MTRRAGATIGAVQTRLVDRLAAGSWVQPTNGVLVRGFTRGHQGIDIIVAGRTPIYAVHDGVVRQAAYDPHGATCSWTTRRSVAEGCWYLEISHSDGTVTRYERLSQRPSVSVGELVRTGQVIGYVGSSGPILHFQTYDCASGRDAVDPVAYLTARGIELRGGAWPVPATAPHRHHRHRGSLRRIRGLVRHRS